MSDLLLLVFYTTVLVNLTSCSIYLLFYILHYFHNCTQVYFKYIT